MARPIQFENKLHARVVYAESDDFRWLKQQGISYSGFFRQAIVSLKKKKWEYNREAEK
jgi:hypothetical protein